MMQRPYYGYNPMFAPQMPSVGFSAPLGYPNAQMTSQSAPAPVSAPTTAVFNVQPVSSREEALAVIADPLSSGVLLPDLGHGVVYMKRFNPNTGASDFAEFALVEPKAAVETPVEKSEWITRKDLEDALAQLRSELTPRSGKRKEAAADE